MTFEINVGTLIAGAAIFLLAIFTKPFVLILRDRAVWWWIERYLLNDKFRIQMGNYQHLNPTIFHRLNMINTFQKDTESEDFVYEKGNVTIRLTTDEFNSMMDSNRKHSEWCVERKLEFDKASSIFNSVVKHYDQDKLNPIDTELEKQRKELDEHSHIILIIAEYFPEKVMKYIQFPNDQYPPD